MLSKKKNELLCRIESGSAMGTTLRENFWVPVALSQKLVADGKPIPLRVFGENFVCFRATDGRLGVFNEYCPHRGASLLLARNDDNALRCIYHGWKFHVDGRTVEVPTEPNNAEAFCRSVPLKHYPTREAAGVIWTWFGKSAPKAFPNFEFMSLPPDQVYVTKQMMRCNWVQNVEAGMDSAHVAVLHQAWFGGVNVPTIISDDRAPVYEFEDFPGGFRYAAIRKMKNNKKYIRISRFVLPWYCFIAPSQYPDGDRLVLMSTPVDDTHVIYWNLKYNRRVPLSPSIHNPAEDPDNFPPGIVGGRVESWGQDRDAMSRGHFSGFPHLNTEDFAVGESQGPIADRSNEYLNSGDLAIVRVRKLLLDMATPAANAGKSVIEFPHDKVDYPDARSYSDVIDESKDWRSLVA